MVFLNNFGYKSMVVDKRAKYVFLCKLKMIFNINQCAYFETNLEHCKIENLGGRDRMASIPLNQIPILIRHAIRLLIIF